MEEANLGRGKMRSKRGMEVVKGVTAVTGRSGWERGMFGRVGLIGFRSGDRDKETSRCLADLGSWVEGGARVEMKGQLDDRP